MCSAANSVEVEEESLKRGFSCSDLSPESNCCYGACGRSSANMELIYGKRRKRIDPNIDSDSDTDYEYERLYTPLMINKEDDKMNQGVKACSENEPIILTCDAIDDEITITPVESSTGNTCNVSGVIGISEIKKEKEEEEEENVKCTNGDDQDVSTVWEDALECIKENCPCCAYYNGKCAVKVTTEGKSSQTTENEPLEEQDDQTEYIKRVRESTYSAILAHLSTDELQSLEGRVNEMETYVNLGRGYRSFAVELPRKIYLYVIKGCLDITCESFPVPEEIPFASKSKLSQPVMKFVFDKTTSTRDCAAALMLCKDVTVVRFTSVPNSLESIPNVLLNSLLKSGGYWQYGKSNHLESEKIIVKNKKPDSPESVKKRKRRKKLYTVAKKKKKNYKAPLRKLSYYQITCPNGVYLLFKNRQVAQKACKDYSWIYPTNVTNLNYVRKSLFEKEFTTHGEVHRRICTPLCTIHNQDAAPCIMRGLAAANLEPYATFEEKCKQFQKSPFYKKPNTSLPRNSRAKKSDFGTLSSKNDRTFMEYITRGLCAVKNAIAKCSRVSIKYISDGLDEMVLE